LGAGAQGGERRTVLAQLERLLDDAAPEVRRNALEALVRLQGVEVLVAVAEVASSDEDQWVQETAGWAIEQLEEARGPA
jgi:HEAT repeat protein